MRYVPQLGLVCVVLFVSSACGGGDDSGAATDSGGSDSGGSDTDSEDAMPTCGPYTGIAAVGSKWTWVTTPSGSPESTPTLSTEEVTALDAATGTVTIAVGGSPSGTKELLCTADGTYLLRSEEGALAGGTTVFDYADEPLLLMPRALEVGDEWTFPVKGVRRNLDATGTVTAEYPFDTTGSGKVVSAGETAIVDASFQTLHIQFTSGTRSYADDVASDAGLIRRAGEFLDTLLVSYEL